MDKRPERIKAIAELWELSEQEVLGIIKWIETHLKAAKPAGRAKVFTRLLAEHSARNKKITYVIKSE